jgi:hypothetical protein
MFIIHSSNDLPRTTVKAVRRSWDERLFPLPGIRSLPTKSNAFVMKIGNNLHIHPENAPSVRRFLEVHKLAYTEGSYTFEPSKTQASMWNV